MTTKEQVKPTTSSGTGSALELKVEAIHNYLIKLSDWLDKNVRPPGGDWRDQASTEISIGLDPTRPQHRDPSGMAMILPGFPEGVRGLMRSRGGVSMRLTGRQIFVLTAAIVGVGAAAVARDPEDKVTLTSNTALHDVTLILIGRRSDNECSLDVVKAGPSTEVGNLLTPGNCRSELAVFAPEHVAILRKIRLGATAGGRGRPHPGRARGCAGKGLGRGKQTGLVALAQSDLTEAENLFEKNHAGITFQPDITQVTGSDVATIGFGCDNAVSLVSSSPPLYDPNRLNVYYVEQIVNFLGIPFRGFYCLDARKSEHHLRVHHPALVHDLDARVGARVRGPGTHGRLWCSPNPGFTSRI